MRMLLLLMLLTTSLLATAQQAKVVRLNAWYDAEGAAEIYDRIPIGLQFIFSDSSEQKTAGLLDGRYKWNRLDVSSSNGTISNGILTFNRQQLIRDHYRITFTVKGDNAPDLHAVITLPQLTGIRFNHYADSIKKDIRFYLNVEGKFSSGKILPLDTATIRFAASSGKILGQDLLIDKTDTVKTVTIEAWYKTNPEMYLRSVMPIKQLPDPDLPPLPGNTPGRRKSGRH
ncbi:hypothetical protein ECE50_026035 [Chitinophaga sp. Mgbs1]|uniref:Uncharacterized protein n=1 Tax=Chitinophaga solisilvae TaxID=1233460 RepID=A0A9Q5GUW7_9BACT|nr:hypothetical protein [Chitinophaga solisilvae]